MTEALEFTKWLISEVPHLLGWVLFAGLAAINMWAIVKTGPALVAALTKSTEVTNSAADSVQSVMAAVESLQATNGQDHRLIMDINREIRTIVQHIRGGTSST